MRRFEHRVNTLQSKPTESWLCAMGNEGWELVSVQWIANYGYEVYFKREIDGSH